MELWVENGKTYARVADLHNWEKNPREINESKFNDLLDSLRKEKQLIPLLVDTRDSKILGGNMTFRALQKLGIEKAWVEPKTPENDAHAFELAIKHNMSYGRYIEDALAELSKLYENDIDLSKLEAYIGDPPNLGSLLIDFFANDIVEDEPPRVSTEEPISRLGEMYNLGKHRLMCGDSTKIEDVEKLMNGQKADISFTSPPYNVGENARLSFHEHDKDNKYFEGYKDSNPQYLQLLQDSLANQMSFSDYVFVNLQMLAGNKTDIITWLFNNKEIFADVMIWDKGNAQPSMVDNVMNAVFEFIFVFSNKANRAVGTGNFRGTVNNVYNAPPQRNNEFSAIHSATFPIHFPSHIISNFCRADGSVLDLFGGSGSTLIASHQLQRTCYMMELDPRYCDVIRRRYWKFINNNDENGWEENTK